MFLNNNCFYISLYQEQEPSTVVPPYLKGIPPKTSSGCMKLWIVPDPTGTVFTRRESGSILEGRGSESFAGGLKEGLTPGNSC